MANKSWNATDFVDTDVIPASEMIKHSQMHGDLGTGRCATVVIAANDSSAADKAQADYVCTGTADQATIQAAVDAVELGSGVDPQHHGKSGAIILLLPGRYSFNGLLTIDKNIFLMGSGFTATEIVLADGSNCGMIDFTNYQSGVDVTYGAGVSHLRLNGNIANQVGDWWTLYGLQINASDAYFDHIWIDQCGVGLTSSSLWSTYFNQISIEECTRGGYFNAAENNRFNFLQFYGMNVHQKFAIRAAATNTYAKDITVKDSNWGIGNHAYNSLELEGNIYDCLIQNCKFNGESAATYHDLLLVDGTPGDPTNIMIENNRFPATGGAGNIGLPTACDEITITRNKFAHATPLVIAAGGNATGKVYRNYGYVTESSGATIIYNTNTDRALTHGLSETPVNGDIVVTPNSNLGSATKFWVGGYTATHFTIYIDQVAGGDLDFTWKAEIL